MIVPFYKYTTHYYYFQFVVNIASVYLTTMEEELQLPWSSVKGWKNAHCYFWNNYKIVVEMEIDSHRSLGSICSFVSSHSLCSLIIATSGSISIATLTLPPTGIWLELLGEIALSVLGTVLRRRFEFSLLSDIDFWNGSNPTTISISPGFVISAALSVSFVVEFSESIAKFGGGGKGRSGVKGSWFTKASWAGEL